MKKVLFALALGTTLVLTSCGGDDDNNTPQPDCFTCTNTSLNQETTYCYTEGNDYYTETIAGGSPENKVFVDGQNWASVKAEIQADPACE